MPDARVGEALHAFKTSGVEIGLAPEGVVDRRLWERWIEALSHEKRAASNLRWVMIGTGPVDHGDPPANTATVVATGGTSPAAMQKKRWPFPLTDGVIEAYKLRSSLPSKGTHLEDIATDGRLTVVESAVGRFLIAICEDVARLFEDAPTYIAVGATHIFVPIFARELLTSDWAVEEGKQLAQKTGATVVIVNNDAIARSRAAAGVDVGEWWTSIVVRPRDGGGAVVHEGRSLGEVHVVVHAAMPT